MDKKKVVFKKIVCVETNLRRPSAVTHGAKKKKEKKEKGLPINMMAALFY